MACPLNIQDIGKIAYEPALELQRQMHASVLEQRHAENAQPFNLLLVEHEPPVLTLSKRPSARDHLIATEEQLAQAGVDLCQTDRGGDITYHGPGQLVGYPICDLNELHFRLHGYMRFLEECIIEVLANFDIKGERDHCATGVWVDNAKICAMGVRVSRWISMHGFALNVKPNMEHFNLIVPCGLAGRQVTSMAELLGEKCPSMVEVKEVTSSVFSEAIERQAQVQ
ncbi:MAG: lipoyl(octanoyl) transferase LipB [Planctomycetota bacterium]|nr:lipoyl(octanoyl) transferase LipB [Planctomycetota bacterium]